VKIDSSNGNILIIDTLPFYFGAVGNSSTFTNPYNNRFYYSNGYNIAGYDLNNFTMISNDTFPLPPIGEAFLNIVFNACDSNAYGIHFNFNLSLGRLAKYNLSTGTLTDISPYVMSLGGFGVGYSIDMVNQLYVYMSGGLKGYDLATGQVVMNTPVQNIPGENIMHIVYDCIDSSFYGTSANSSAGTKYFSKIDPVTGIVMHVSNNNLNTYIWKNGTSLFTIDPFSGIYYYRSGALISVDVQTGIGSPLILNLNPGTSFDNMTYFPQCQCNLNTQVAEVSQVQKQINIYPNPTTDFITIHYKSTSEKETTVSLFNLYGQQLRIGPAFSEPGSNVHGTFALPEGDLPTHQPGKHEIKIDIRNFPAGIYFVKMSDGGNDEVRKVVKY